MKKSGSYISVGTGIALGGQISVISKSYIENADIVFGIMPNSECDEWMSILNKNYVSLQPFYSEEKIRIECYQDMVSAIMDEVRAGKKVVGAFYGHPGVFAWVPHEAVRQALSEGYSAHMEPGISAEDCLYADLGVDPGNTGCLAYEATQFLFYKHAVDTSCLLILWQIALAGDHTLKTFEPNKSNIELTIKYLSQWYPLDHKVVVYEAPFLPTESARKEEIALRDLSNVSLSMISTLVIPPAKDLEIDTEALKLFGVSEQQLAFN
ncbi:hypothetical protein FLL45_02680 [Aliikangiella marina]|uniref:Tetrapyrrole methylase domain-containing protein n=1 Tax=Aliikangiella marina TaxID=1712262 RepID=A0A545TI21_9GAMM|nr:SAM-dependent methyltransferase [Aliikangiella marina]TQV76877.1 hypothetical protein FLL45_02680 [Aliikangiella marina]